MSEGGPLCTEQAASTQEAKYVERWPGRLLPGLAGADLIFQWIGLLEYIPCYGGPAEHWGPLPATRLASRKILIEQNIKKWTGPALCVLCGQYSRFCTAIRHSTEYTVLAGLLCTQWTTFTYVSNPSQPAQADGGQGCPSIYKEPLIPRSMTVVWRPAYTPEAEFLVPMKVVTVFCSLEVVTFSKP